MKPSDELIEKFRQTFIGVYGEDMTTQEAYDNFTSLVDILRIISRSMEQQERQDQENPNPVFPQSFGRIDAKFK